MRLTKTLILKMSISGWAAVSIAPIVVRLELLNRPVYGGQYAAEPLSFLRLYQFLFHRLKLFPVVDDTGGYLYHRLLAEGVRAAAEFKRPGA